MRKIFVSFTAGIGMLLLAGVVFAAPGDQIAPPGPILPANGCGANNGVGVAFDGTHILFTCAGEAAVRMTDTTGANLGSVATSDAGGNPVSLDAIAWDPNESLLWGGDLDGAGSCRIWSLDMATGVATQRFTFTDPTGQGRCSEVFYDGITVDPNTDTLYLSPDVHTEIYHKNKDGTAGVNGTIPFEALTAGQCPWAAGFGATGCYNSGLTMGLDGNLFAGTAQDGKIFQLNPTAPASLVGQFASVTGRDEDLECGPLVNGFETILSRDYETGRIDVLEAPDGTCVITEITLDPTSATNDLTVDSDHTVTATVTANGQPLAGVTVDFSISSGPNVGEVSDPGECTVNPNCATDAAGRTSWSYTSSGLGTDVIVACYVTATGTKHCAEARKAWQDQTPPVAACTETTNPHGKTTPPAGSTTLPGSHGGQNEDGFYLLSAEDGLDPSVEIFVNGFGPFVAGDKVKVTEAPGQTPEMKKMGSDNGQAGEISAHLILDSDPLLQAVDNAGNTTEVTCFVPPPPK